MNRTDEELVRRTLAGEREAFDVLVRRYQGAAYGLAYHHMRDYATAEDVAQQAFISAFVHLRQVRQPERFASWLKAVVVNECRMWLRRHRPEASLAEGDEMPDPSPSPAERWERRELQATVRRAIGTLPEKTRLLVSLHYLAGMPYAEIARFLEVPITTVEGRLFRARRMLKEAMIPMMEEELSEHRLPASFAQDVATKLSITPEGWFSMSMSEGAHTLFLAPENAAGPAETIAVTMRPTDAAAIVPQMFPSDAAAQAKSRAFASATEVLTAFGVRLEQVVLRLDDHGRLTARTTWRKGRGTRTIELPASDALALAARLRAPVRAEEPVLRQRAVGEQGLLPAMEAGNDDYAAEMRHNRPRASLEAVGFDIGLDPAAGRDTVRYQADEAAGALTVTVPGSGHAPLALPLSEHHEALRQLQELAERPEVHTGLVRDGREFRTHYSRQEGDIELRFTPVPPAS